MRLAHRFTRDEVSAKVWWPFALLLVVLLVVSFPLRNRAIDAERDRASERAAAIVDGVVEPAASTLDPAEPVDGSGYQELRAAIVEAMRTSADPVVAIKLWNAAGPLLFSTLAAEQEGSAAAVNDRWLAAASADPSALVSISSTSAETGGTSPPRFVVYSGLGEGKIVAQVEMAEADLLSDIRRRWLGYQIVLGVAAGLVLLLAGLSIREPVARIGAGVPFYISSVPANLSVISAEEATRLRQAGAHSQDRLGSMQTTIDELQTENYKLQGELQNSLSLLATLRPQKPEAVIPRPAEPELVAEPEALVGSQPEPEPEAAVEPEPTPEHAVAAEPEPETEPGSEPEAEPEREEVVVVPEAEPVTMSSEMRDDPVGLLELITTPAGTETLHPELDPTDLRAKLARSADQKKPGARTEERTPEQR